MHELDVKNGTGTARIGIAMEPDWVGKSINAEGRKDQGLREALIKAQRDVLNLVQVVDQGMDDLKIRWVTEEIDGTGYHWNPQIPLQPDVAVIYCIAECVYV